MLSAVLLDPAALAKIPELAPDDFYAGPHRRLFEAIRAVEGTGQPIEVVTVSAWLKDQERLAEVGGNGRIAEMLDAAPAVSNVSAYAAIVRSKAMARETALIMTRSAARVRDGGEDPAAVLADLERDSGALVERYRPRRVVTPAEHVMALARRGPLVRFETGLRTLDDACRGGLPAPRFVVFGGAPGTGKTSLVTWLGWRWARGGVPVLILAQDEGPEGTFMRIGQIEGLGRRELETREEATLKRLAALLDGSALDVLDGEDEHGTVERAAALVAARAGKTPGVLVVDSIQTVRALGTAEAPSARERVDAVVRALKRARDRYGLLVLATCELARAAYRDGEAVRTYNMLAAFKESGAIEYGAETALVLRGVPDQASMVDVVVPKNRGPFGRPPFRLHMERETASFEEVELPPESERRGPRPTVEVDARRVFAVLLRSPGMAGVKALRAAVHEDGPMSNDRITAAVTHLRERGAILDRGEGGRPRWYAEPAAMAPPKGAEDAA